MLRVARYNHFQLTKFKRLFSNKMESYPRMFGKKILSKDGFKMKAFEFAFMEIIIFSMSKKQFV